MLLLEIEGKKPVQVQDFALVEKTLRSLKSYGPASFAILTKEDGSYVQVAGGEADMRCRAEVCWNRQADAGPL